MLAPISAAWKIARVEYSIAQAGSAIGLLAGVGAERGPGLDQADAIQVATHLALLRHGVLGADLAKVAVYEQAAAPAWNTFTMGRFLGTFAPGQGPKNAYRIPIVGTERLWTRPAGPGLPVDWSRVLALAIDEVLARIAKAESGASQPSGERSTADLQVLPLGILTVIVGGAAAVIIGATALWRYLDPALRADIAAIEQAGSDYKKRLHLLKTTGVLPAPSENEKSLADRVEARSKTQIPGRWVLGGSIAGGVLAGILLSAALTRGPRSNPGRVPILRGKAHRDRVRLLRRLGCKVETRGDLVLRKCPPGVRVPRA